MKTTIGLACAAITLGAAIASCGGSGNVATPGATPTPTVAPTAACTTPPNEQIQVVYPKPNSANVTTGNIIIAVAPNPLPSTNNLYVNVFNQNSAGGPIPQPTGASFGTAQGTTLQTIPFGQVPSDALIPPFPFPVYQQSNFGGIFGAGLVFQIYLGSAACSPGVNLNSSFAT
jgi:hypothetical protein